MKVSFEISDLLSFLLGIVTGVIGMVICSKLANLWRKRGKCDTTPSMDEAKQPIRLDEAKQPVHLDKNESDKVAKVPDASSSDDSGDTNDSDSDPTFTDEVKTPTEVENDTSVEVEQVSESTHSIQLRTCYQIALIAAHAIASEIDASKVL